VRRASWPALAAVLLLSSAAQATPRIAADRRVLDFGRHGWQQNAIVRTFELRNLGDTPLTVGSFQSAANFFALTATPLVIAPGARAPVDVQLTPFQPGKLDDSLTIVSDDPVEPRLAIGLTARIVADTVTASPNGIDFGVVHVGTSVEGPPIALTNRTSDPVTIDGFSLGDDAGQFSVGGVPVTLAPGGRADVNVWFAPTRGGPVSASLQLTAGFNVFVDVGLDAIGLLSAVAATPGEFALDATIVGQRSNVQVVTLENVTASPLQIASITVDDPAFALEGAGAARLEPSAGVTFDVSFAPTEVGERQARIAVTLDGASAPEQVILVDASGILPPSPPAPPPGVLGAACSFSRAPSSGAAPFAIALLLICLRHRRATGRTARVMKLARRWPLRY